MPTTELKILLKVTQQFPSGAGNLLTAGVQNNQGTLLKEHFFALDIDTYYTSRLFLSWQ